MKRRTFIGGIVAAGAAAAAGLYRFTDLFVKHYPPTPYDDLLVQLVDRPHAVEIGRRLRTIHGYEADFGDRAAKELRQRLSRADIKSTTERDIAIGQMIEIDGWQMPLTLFMLCRLAAYASGAD